MKSFCLSLGLLLMLLALPGAGHAVIYKWVDANGTISYRDTPPPAGQQATIVEPKGSVIESTGLVDSLKETAAEALDYAATQLDGAKAAVAPERRPAPPPVELYVTSWCGYCKKARAFLRSRGIPFREYDVERDAQAARRLAGFNSRGGVPVAVIGDQVLLGFYQPAYERALGLD